MKLANHKCAGKAATSQHFPLPPMLAFLSHIFFYATLEGTRDETNAPSHMQTICTVHI